MKAASKKENGAVFTQGSTMRHVLTMTGTGAVGLVSIFFVDVINLFYIALLGEQELAAAIGYASTIMFFTVSVSIGFAIAATAITARAIGAGDEETARKNAGTSIVYMIIMSVIVLACILPSLPFLLDLLGAQGETKKISLRFMQIAIPSFPFLCIGMGLSALLRAKGDAKRAMYVTLSVGAIALFVDPILIFGFGLGLDGAAIAIIVVRIFMMFVGLYFAIKIHNMIAIPDFGSVVRTVRPFLKIAVPAVLTQIATPVGNAYVTAAIAEFGDDAVAGWAIVGRLMPLAFAAVFSLSGAVGPILSQNLGAKKFDRVTRAMWDSLLFGLIYCVAVWVLLAVFSSSIIAAFNAENDSALLVRFFCLFVAGSFIFNGALFVANAAFNNLGFPIYSTVFNWGRATLGIVPFVWVGKSWGPEGVLAGWGAGGVIFGIISVLVCFRALKRLPERVAAEEAAGGMPVLPTANSPFTSGKGASAG